MMDVRLIIHLRLGARLLDVAPVPAEMPLPHAGGWDFYAVVPRITDKAEVQL